MSFAQIFGLKFSDCHVEVMASARRAAKLAQLRGDAAINGPEWLKAAAGFEARGNP